MIVQEARCKHFLVCGGCKYQNIPYEEQLARKQAFVSSCFNRSTEPILPSFSPWQYRNKMEFSFAQSRKGEKFLGLMKQRGRVENLEECHLVRPWFIEVLKNVRQWWQKNDLTAYHPPTNQGLLRTLTLREGIQTGEKMAMLTVSEEHFAPEYLASFMEVIPEVHALILRRQITQKKVPTRFEEKVLRGANHIHEILHDASGHPYRFRIRGSSFFQPNTLQAEIIYQKALEYIQLNNSELVLDLYCGTGSFGIFVSRQAKRVLGVEINPEAVQDARENLILNQIRNMEVVAGDVKNHLQQSAFVIIDPPRAGLGPHVIEQLRKMNPKTILYVSCNPASQAKDCEQLGYEILNLQPIDQFPHTPHVENIALLRSKS